MYDIQEEIEVMSKLGGEEEKIKSTGDKAVKNDELEKEDTQDQKSKEDMNNQEMSEKEEENEYILERKKRRKRLPAPPA